MIYLDFGIECKIDWLMFLSVKTFDNKILYKSDFTAFSELYEFICKNINDVYHLRFDNYEYFLENGLLHNLYGPAKIRYSDGSQYLMSERVNNFFINGINIFCNDRECRKLIDFETHEIYYFEEITNKKTIPGTYHRREGQDYIKHVFDLNLLRKQDIRKKKLRRILNENVQYIC